jgi:hypothetical protein
MACATLKRTLDFDPVHNQGRPSKRRRCVPICASPNVASTKQHPSPFGEVCPKLTPGNYCTNIPQILILYCKERKPPSSEYNFCN